MYIHLIRNQPKGTAITGRLVINGRYFCNTLERKGYEIPALCYPVRVTMSPRFKRLLPIVQNVPQRSGIRIHRGSKPEHSSGCVLVVADNKNDNTDNLRGNQLPAALKENIPFRSRDIDSSGCVLVVGDNKNENTDNLRGNQLPAALKENIPFRSRDIDSSGCVLVVEDNKNDNTDNLRPNQYSLGAHGENNHSRGRDILISLRSNDRLCRTIASGTLSPLSSNNNSLLSSKHIPVGARSAADVETQLTQLLLQTQESHEEIILEVIDFRPGTELGYNTLCPPELQKP